MAAEAAAGLGLGSMLGGIGGALGGLSGLGSTIYGIIQAGQQRPETAAWQNFQRVKQPVQEAVQQLYYNPAYTGYYERGFQEPTIVQQLAPGQTLQQKYGYKWSPTESTQRLYESYLGREYGLPDTLARALVSQAQAPLRVPGIGQQNLSAAQANRAFNIDPQVLAQAQLQKQSPETLRQLNYLQNAGQLAAFNLWRTQQLPQLIG